MKPSKEEALQMTAQDMKAMADNASDAAALLKTLGHECRLLIMCNLLDGEKTVTQLNQQVPLSQSALSQHLARLRNEGLVSIRKEAQMVYYSLRSEKVERVIGLLHDMYCK